jgi:branched-chain amino acid aminotransferase
MSEPLAYLNGQWIPASAAVVPVDDAGFVLGASVAEQLRTFAGKLFRLDDHLARLDHSLEIVGLDLGVSRQKIAQVAEELVAHNHRLLPSGDDLRLSIVVTPGGHPAYRPPGPSRPTVCLHTHPLAFHLWADKYRTGQALVTTEIRQVPGQCWPSELKCRSRMHYYLADRQAAANDPEARALLLDADGFVTEASTANLLVYRAGEGLLSPPWRKILHGISMSVTRELAQRLGISFVERDLTVDDVATADEAMLTSTSMSILPVTFLNGHPISPLKKGTGSERADENAVKIDGSEVPVSLFQRAALPDGQPGKIFAALLAAWSWLVGLDIAAQAARRSR